jgi:hypothetical protein
VQPNGTGPSLHAASNGKLCGKPTGCALPFESWPVVPKDGDWIAAASDRGHGTIAKRESFAPLNNPLTLTEQDPILRVQMRCYAVGPASDQQVGDRGKHLIGAVVDADDP